MRKRKLGNKVRVTFILPPQEGHQSVSLVGDFNRWDVRATPMARNEEGNWEVKLDLKPNRKYQFRYLINQAFWRNDPAADGSVRNPFGADNSIVSTHIETSDTGFGPRKSAVIKAKPSGQSKR